MPNSILTALRTASLLVIIAGFLALSTTSEYDATLVLIPIILGAIMSICEQLDVQFTGYRKMTTAINVVVFPAVLVAPMFLGLLNAVIMLVIYIQIYLVLHRKRERDYYYMYLMAFFLLVASCVLSPEPVIGLVMLLFLISSIWAFLILQIYVETERNQNATTPDLMSLKEHDYQVIAPPERWLDAGVVLPVSGMCAIAIVLTAALFLFTPRMEAGFFGRNDTTRFVTGLDSEVEVSTSGEIEPDPRIVLRAEFPDEPDGRYDGEFFWRACSYNTYNGARWTRRRMASDYSDKVPDGSHRIPVNEESEERTLLRNPSRDGRIVHQVIYLDEGPNEGLPCLSTVVQLNFTPPIKTMRISWSDDNDSSILLRSPRQSSISYEAWSEVEDDVSAELLRQSPDNYERTMGRRDFQRLTDYDLTPAAEALARELTEAAATTYDKVRALEAWFHSPDFLYSLSIPQLDPAHPIDDFLLNYRIGHCELFATAMALMLRSLDIPCRVVSGYRGAEWVQSEEAYIVSADMAHLWVEVYFLDQGWFSFDPSPPIDRALTRMGRWSRLASLMTMRAKMFWLSQVVGFRGLQWADFRSFSAGLFDFSGDPMSPGVGGGNIGVPVVVLFALLGVIAFVFYVRSLWRNPTTVRRRLTLDQIRAQRLFRVMRTRLKKVGIVADGKSAEELAEECSGYAHGPRQSLIDALQVYNAARFGGRPLPAEQLAKLKHGLRILKEQTKHG